MTVANVENLAPEKDAMVKNVTAKGLIGFKVQTNRRADFSARSSQLKLILYGFESKLFFSEIILCQ